MQKGFWIKQRMITRKRLRVIITSVQKPRRTLFSNWEYCSEGYSSAIVKTARTARVDRSGRQPRDASDWNWDKVVPDAMAFDKPIYRSRIYLVMTKPANECSGWWLGYISVPIFREPETKVQVIKSLEKVFEDQSLLVAFSFASDSFEFLETAWCCCDRIMHTKQPRNLVHHGVLTLCAMMHVLIHHTNFGAA